MHNKLHVDGSLPASTQQSRNITTQSQNESTGDGLNNLQTQLGEGDRQLHFSCLQNMPLERRNETHEANIQQYTDEPVSFIHHSEISLPAPKPQARED